MNFMNFNFIDFVNFMDFLVSRNFLDSMDFLDYPDITDYMDILDSEYFLDSVDFLKNMESLDFGFYWFIGFHKLMDCIIKNMDFLDLIDDLDLFHFLKFELWGFV